MAAESCEKGGPGVQAPRQTIHGLLNKNNIVWAQRLVRHKERG